MQIIDLNADDIQSLRDRLNESFGPVLSMSIAIDGDAFKVKTNGGAWSLPFGRARDSQPAQLERSYLPTQSLRPGDVVRSGLTGGIWCRVMKTEKDAIHDGLYVIHFVGNYTVTVYAVRGDHLWEHQR